MRKFPRPRVVVSACLEFEKVRYNGQVVPCELVKKLEPYVDFIKVCPEFAIGLGVPREPIRIIKSGEDYRLVQPRTGRDVTGEMNTFTDDFLQALPTVDGFIFKSKSPTIGLSNIKVYSGPFDPGVVERRSGFFATKVLQKYRGFPIEEDTRLINDKIRHHFLTWLFSFAGFREATAIGSLKEFHRENSYLFTLYDGTAYTKMGGKLDDPVLYFEAMRQLFLHMPEPSAYVNGALSAFNRYSDDVNPLEKKWFLETVGMYRDNKICLNGLLEALKLFIMRFDDNAMMSQTLFEPYPSSLVSDVDLERDKDYMRKTVVELF